jgi:hypothetical protein
MSYRFIKSLYDSITGDTNITQYVNKGDIKVGWQTNLTSFPCITIIGLGGNAVGTLGYNHPSGNINENYGVQIEIYSRKSLKENYDICDKIMLNMFSNGYEKLSDVDDYEDNLKSHLKITRWKKEDIYTK